MIRARTEKNSIGFGADITSSGNDVLVETLRQLEPEDLIKFGLIPEFVGRLPVVATLEELDIKALVEILVEPRNALLKQYKKLFALEDAELEILPEALEAVAQLAMERKTGARGLRSILEHALLETMYELPSIPGVVKVVVDAEVITEGKRPYYIYAEDENRRAS